MSLTESCKHRRCRDPNPGFGSLQSTIHPSGCGLAGLFGTTLRKTLQSPRVQDKHKYKYQQFTELVRELR
eukprot:COSAG02_NODE_10587_length_1906_cov_2.235750_2_plen_70_part_00